MLKIFSLKFRFHFSLQFLKPPKSFDYSPFKKYITQEGGTESQKKVRKSRTEEVGGFSAKKGFYLKEFCAQYLITLRQYCSEQQQKAFKSLYVPPSYTLTYPKHHISAILPI